MADGSTIEWTDATWNPIVGCSVISPGCQRCYAMKLAGGARPRTEVLWLNPACVRALDGADGPMFAGLRA